MNSKSMLILSLCLISAMPCVTGPTGPEATPRKRTLRDGVFMLFGGALGWRANRVLLEPEPSRGDYRAAAGSAALVTAAFGGWWLLRLRPRRFTGDQALMEQLRGEALIEAERERRSCMSFISIKSDEEVEKNTVFMASREKKAQEILSKIESGKIAIGQEKQVEINTMKEASSDLLTPGLIKYLLNLGLADAVEREAKLAAQVVDTTSKVSSSRAWRIAQATHPFLLPIATGVVLGGLGGVVASRANQSSSLN